MKKLLVYAIAALSLVACAQEMVPEKEPENNEVIEKVKVSFKASLSQESLSKADINMTDGTGSWEIDDEIAIHTKNGALAILKAESDGAAVTFSGFIDSGDAILDGAVAYYPASIAVEGYGSKVNLPTSYASAAAAAKSFPLRGVIDGDEVEFKHIGSLMKISINNVPSSVTTIEFTAPNKAVTGDFSIDGTPECITIGSLEGSTTVSIASSAAERTSSTSEFYLPMPTGTLSGFSIVLKKGSSELYTKSTANSVTLTRASLSKMKAFTPEGSGSGWYVVGGFNGWDPTTSVEMKSILGLDYWVVARNQSIAKTSGNDGFKFLYGQSWDYSYGTSETISLQKEYQSYQDGADITYGSNTGTYDIYFNTNSHKFYLSSPNDPSYRTIYLMTDMELSDGTYYLHVWPNGGGAGTYTSWPGIAGTVETISGIKYYKFEMGVLSAGTYNCSFNNGNTPSVRYDFTSGQLVVPNDDSASYYLSFTSTVWNGNKGEGNDNPMTQFTDPAQPQGASTWKVLDNSIGSSGKYYDMKWGNCPALVCRAVPVNTSSQLVFRFTNGSVNHFYYASGAVAPNSDFAVTFKEEGSRSSIAKFSVEGLTEETYFDIYLDVNNKTAKVVPLEMTTLYFSLDREVSNAYLYTWGDFSTSAFPGMEMTNYETINGKKYYKASIPVSEAWDYRVNMIVSDGNYEGHWQTSNFTTADLSGSKSEYFFKVNGNAITQLSGRPEAISISIDGDFDDWSNEDIASKDYSGILANFKAWSDGSHLYLYHSFDGSKITLEGWKNYMNLYIDKDNSDSTGDATKWFGYGFDGDLEFYFCKNEEVVSSFDGIYYKVYNDTNSVWEESTYTASNIDWDGTKDSSNNIKIEWSIPLADIGVSNNSVIRLGFVARKPEATNGNRSNTLVVTIPAAPNAD